jgi:DNA-binding MarR family transcriptional regulator
VRREQHPDDGRATLVVITDAGTDVSARATEALNAEVFSRPGLGRDDTEELVSIIARLRRDAGDFDDPRPVPEPL